MQARSDMPISFPGLFGDWEFNPDPVAIHWGNGIYWYGIIIVAGLLLAVLFCCRQAKRYGLTEDNVYDLIIWELPLCVIGARVYYVIFYLDLYRRADGTLDWMAMLRIWDGGLAIYGAVIVAFFVLMIFCKIKKLSFGAFADLGCMGLLIGQAIGRWGNFINREAFGGETDLPWRMRLWTSATEYIEVHPPSSTRACGISSVCSSSSSSSPRPGPSTGRTPASTSSGTASAGPGSRGCAPTACTCLTGLCSVSPSGCPRPSAWCWWSSPSWC